MTVLGYKVKITDIGVDSTLLRVSELNAGIDHAGYSSPRYSDVGKGV